MVFDATAKVAFMLHIQPETLSRVLKRLARDETICIENGEVTIKNKESLISIFKGVGV